MAVPAVATPAAPAARSVGGARPHPLVAAIVAVLVAATGIPIGYVLWGIVSVGWHRAYELVVRPRVADLLFNTVALVLVTVPLCVLIGVGVAWLVERTDLPGRALWRPLFVAPLAVPAFVNSYAWVGVVPSLHGLWAGVLVTTLSYFPFLYLPVAATLRRLDPAVEESARALGSNTFEVFFRVVLPQLRLAILGGGLLIALHLLAEYGAFAMVRFETFTVAIFQQFQVNFDGAAGSMLASVLVALCVLLLVAEAAARGPARFARIGSGAQRTATPIHLRHSVIPATLALTALAVLSIGVPLWTLLRWLWIGGTGVWDIGDITSSLSQTIGLAATAAVITTMLAYPVAWVAVRSSGFLARAVEGANYVTSSLPGIVTALALVTVAIQLARPLYQSMPLIVFAYVLLFMPRALINVRAGLAQVPPGLEEASRSLGASPAATFLRVTLRLTAPAAAAGASLVFVAVATELTATLLLAPTGTNTLAMRFWSLSSELDYAAAAPYALVLVVLAIPVTVILFRQSTKAAAL
ncbi:binding--dependent transport system inner membrane component family protein [Mycolicibacterium hassiacum DSM 44199]|uniref:Binding--dependent transport system inner membrane component family protein n=1 Tax=Mycolicibacterium hassiacum (strain DSM 44199 / CIP 105218 / JCM 12690 / 3849) TaxID=1122247 RepID=K5B779_MYCHD|nr:iron ABC transporter permease [Mycolicibacterium hassiacum]EKF21478.1 binding--dependent transport system inner membrane component family protein [Mycolicibacterium hassiacum DSM 44199]MBX5488850.1 iron ABC transporter permease [Mycolicibacterium hassiacum]MDA4087109.1 iron ABC transporter permease [Mycolicibacterium hassiacum DSM 44199]PZN22015.1 MAG: iron ABC transporter permease [Mycolicibacterium hassiacum]VCT89340.1 Sulfate transport system permease protein CysW [Mycolicibacterium hass